MVRNKETFSVHGLMPFMRYYSVLCFHLRNLQWLMEGNTPNCLWSETLLFPLVLYSIVSIFYLFTYFCGYSVDWYIQLSGNYPEANEPLEWRALGRIITAGSGHGPGHEQFSCSPGGFIGLSSWSFYARKGPHYASQGPRFWKASSILQMSQNPLSSSTHAFHECEWYFLN